MLVAGARRAAAVFTTAEVPAFVAACPFGVACLAAVGRVAGVEARRGLPAAGAAGAAENTGVTGAGGRRGAVCGAGAAENATAGAGPPRGGFGAVAVASLKATRAGGAAGDGGLG
ncbi:hypothetical protein Pen02_80200 [Plantactinospora endophytica]|uniref:Uncharacterized protein n=1 Tax=Plantactinospora endophytica TaxID=673535 RepID=A0ABQ4EED4_9ACTN|nr:hypothetical protein Pen02_80200 [Plantactinospora endophytica]